MGKRSMVEPPLEESSASRQRIEDSRNSCQSVSLDINRAVNLFLEGPHHSFHEVDPSFVILFLISSLTSPFLTMILLFFFS